MTTPRSRFSLAPVLLALFVGFMSLPALNIFRVDARGLGHEHALPWRARTSGLAGLAMSALTLMARFRYRISELTRNPLFRPATVGIALLLALVLHRDLAFAAPVLGTTLTEGTHAGEFLISERGGIGAPSRENITVLSGQNLTAGAVVGRVKYGVGRVSIPTVSGTGNGTASLVFAGPEVEVGSYVLTCTAIASHGGVFSLTTPGGKALPALTLTGGSGATTAYTSRHINFSITDGGTDFAVGDSFTFVVSTTAPTVIGGTGTGTISAISLGPDAKPGNYRVINRAVVSHGGDFEVIAPDGTSVGRFLMGTTTGAAATFTTRQISFTLTDATDFILGNYFDVCVYNELNGGKVVAWDPTTFDGRHRAYGVLFDAVNATSADMVGVTVCRDAAVLKAALQWGASITSSQKESAYLDLEKRGIVAR